MAIATGVAATVAWMGGMRVLDRPLPVESAPIDALLLEQRLESGVGHDRVSVYSAADLEQLRQAGIPPQHVARMTEAAIALQPELDASDGWGLKRMLEGARANAATEREVLDALAMRNGSESPVFHPYQLAGDVPLRFLIDYARTCEERLGSAGIPYGNEIVDAYRRGDKIEDLERLLSLEGRDRKPFMDRGALSALRAPQAYALRMLGIATRDGPLHVRADFLEMDHTLLIYEINDAYRRGIAIEQLQAWTDRFDRGERHTNIAERLGRLSSEDGPSLLACVERTVGAIGLTYRTVDASDAYRYCALGLRHEDVESPAGTPLPDAVVVLPYSDHNGVFESEAERQLIAGMRAHYDVAIATVRTPRDIAALAERFPDAELVDIGGHGSPTSLELDAGPAPSATMGESHLAQREFASRGRGLTSADPMLAQYFAGFRRSPAVLLDSCETAKEPGGKMMSLADALYLRSGLRVIAARRSFNPANIYVMRWRPLAARIIVGGIDATYDTGAAAPR